MNHKDHRRIATDAYSSGTGRNRLLRQRDDTDAYRTLSIHGYRIRDGDHYPRSVQARGLDWKRNRDERVYALTLYTDRDDDTTKMAPRRMFRLYSDQAVTFFFSAPRTILLFCICFES